jgi:hypothetical protein
VPMIWNPSDCHRCTAGALDSTTALNWMLGEGVGLSLGHDRGVDGVDQRPVRLGGLPDDHEQTIPVWPRRLSSRPQSRQGEGTTQAWQS